MISKLLILTSTFFLNIVISGYSLETKEFVIGSKNVSIQIPSSWNLVDLEKYESLKGVDYKLSLIKEDYSAFVITEIKNTINRDSLILDHKNRLIKYFKLKEIVLSKQEQTTVFVSGIEFIKLTSEGNVEQDINFNSIEYFGLVDGILIVIESLANSPESRTDVISMWENAVIK